MLGRAPLFAAAAALVLGTYGRSQTPPDRGKRVIAECIEALGGERFLNMRNREESGRAYSFYRDQLSGLSIATIYTEYLSPGHDTANQLAVRERENFGKKQDYGVLFTQDGAFDITFRGARPLEPERFQRYTNTTLRDIFYILRIRRNEPGLLFESRGADVVDNRAVEILDITDAANQTVTVYFDTVTKLPVREVFERMDPKTRLRDQEITYFTKYRAVDGIQWPFAIERARNGEKTFELFSETVKLNQDLPEKTFQKTMH